MAVKAFLALLSIGLMVHSVHDVNYVSRGAQRAFGLLGLAGSVLFAAIV